MKANELLEIISKQWCNTEEQNKRQEEETKRGFWKRIFG